MGGQENPAKAHRSKKANKSGKTDSEADRSNRLAKNENYLASLRSNAQKVLIPLFRDAVMPTEKCEVLEKIRSAMLSALKALHDVHDTRKKIGEEREHLALVERNAEDRTLLVENTRRDLKGLLDLEKKQLEIWNSAHKELKQAHKHLVSVKNNGFGVGVHKKTDDGEDGEKVVRFSENAVYVVGKCSIHHAILALQHVSGACQVLSDIRSMYQVEEIRELERDLDSLEKEVWGKSQRSGDKGLYTEEFVAQFAPKFDRIRKNAEQLKIKIMDGRKRARYDSEVDKIMNDMAKLRKQFWGL